MEPGAPDRTDLLGALTIEHVSLQTARSATVTESVGRSLIYLGSLSATLVALALIAQSDGTADDFRVCALLVLPTLVFLGSVTFVRIIETGIEDAIYARAIGRIRHYYIELAGDDARYFLLSGRDDMEGALANMGITAAPWRPFLSVASVIALINSVVAGALCGVALDAFVPRSVALVVALVVVAIALTVHYRLGFRHFVQALDGFTPIFTPENGTERSA